MAEKESPYWTFVAARDSGNEEEAISLAWDAVGDLDLFCDGQAAYLRNLMKEYGDINGLRRLRKDIERRIRVGPNQVNNVERLEQELVRIDRAIEVAGMVNEICDAVQRSPGISRAELWGLFDVYRDRKQHAKAVADGVDPDAPWITATRFDRLLTYPLLEVDGKGKDAKVSLSGRSLPKVQGAATGCLVTLLLIAALAVVAVL